MPDDARTVPVTLELDPETAAALQDPAAQSGIYNVGSGVARSFLDVASILFKELGVAPDVEFIDLPANLQDKYQYYTCARMDKLKAAGFAKPLTSLEDGLRRYVGEFLGTEDPFR